MPIFLILVVVSQANAQSNKKLINDAAFEFQSGSYSSSIELLNKAKTRDKKLTALKFYLLGLSYNKIQNYQQAAQSFKKAHENEHDAKDLYYEWGQALYANNQLEQARKAFHESYVLSHKATESLYYKAYISQILLEYRRAIKYYKELIKTDKNDPNLRQIAHFQMAESILSLSENFKKKKKKLVIQKTVLPLLRLAVKTSPKGDAHKDIKQRIQELQDQFGLDPNKMVNGRRISDKRWKVYAAQRLKYDDNVTLANDQPTVTITQQDSYISESVLDFTYESIFQREYALEYRLRLQNIHHHDRKTSEVYKNDRYVLSPEIKGTWEHKINGKMAASELSFTYDYTGQDVDAQKEKSFFSRSFNIGLSERVRLLPFGDTVFKLKYKRYRNKSELQHFNSFGFGVDQIAILPNRDLIVALFNYTDIDNFNNTNASSATLVLRADYIMTRIIPKVDLTFSLSFSALDTKEQSETRGTEKTVTPSIKLSRKISDSLRLSFEHSVTSKSSLSEQNEYDKKITSFELRYLY